MLPEIEAKVAAEQPLLKLEYGHKVKIGMCLRAVAAAKTKDKRDYWQNTLDLWNARAIRAGFPDAETWLESA
jgi:hypothetical protein